MEQLQLFNVGEYQLTLTPTQRDHAVSAILTKVTLADKFFYSVNETCSILHCTKSELYFLLETYRLDAVFFRALYRIPWYDLAAFIITDPEDTLEKDYYEYFKHKAA